MRAITPLCCLTLAKYIDNFFSTLPCPWNPPNAGAICSRFQKCQFSEGTKTFSAIGFKNNLQICGIWIQFGRKILKMDWVLFFFSNNHNVMSQMSRWCLTGWWKKVLLTGLWWLRYKQPVSTSFQSEVWTKNFMAQKIFPCS